MGKHNASESGRPGVAGFFGRYHGLHRAEDRTQQGGGASKTVRKIGGFAVGGRPGREGGSWDSKRD